MKKIKFIIYGRSVIKMNKKGFTLIELLIVVAIIAILAAIAVPNFLEAQVRSKVSRAKSDLRTVATGIEAYSVDYNSYPSCNPYAYALCPISATGAGFKPTLERLTTPIAYIATGSALNDPFWAQKRFSSTNYSSGVPSPVTTDPRDTEVAKTYRYTARNEGSNANWDETGGLAKPKWWILESCGPDRTTHNLSGIILAPTDDDAGLKEVLPTQYDPTNGTVSRGSVWRIGGQPCQPGRVFYRACTINSK